MLMRTDSYNFVRVDTVTLQNRRTTRPQIQAKHEAYTSKSKTVCNDMNLQSFPCQSRQRLGPGWKRRRIASALHRFTDKRGICESLNCMSTKSLRQSQPLTFDCRGVSWLWLCNASRVSASEFAMPRRPQPMTLQYRDAPSLWLCNTAKARTKYGIAFLESCFSASWICSVTLAAKLW